MASANEKPLQNGAHTDLNVHENGDHKLSQEHEISSPLHPDAKAPDTVDAADIYLSPQEEKKLLRRIDLWIVPYASLLYLLSFLDSECFV